MKKKTFDEYYMDIAKSIEERADCLGKKVGAIIVVENRIVATGYNGTPEGSENCTKKGCFTCLEKKLRRRLWAKSKENRKHRGKGYDECICVHAEQNALASAARFGIIISGGVLYSTYQPCFGCSKILLQAKIRRVVYLNEWEPDRRLKRHYESLQTQFIDGCWKLAGRIQTSIRRIA